VHESLKVGSRHFIEIDSARKFWMAAYALEEFLKAANGLSHRLTAVRATTLRVRPLMFATHDG
jgi:hypothetical protein